MKKHAFRSYLAFLLALAVFHVVAFVIPHPISPTYWLGYGFTTAAFLLQLLFAFLAFGRADTAPRTFLGLSVFRLGLLYLALQLIWGLVCMFAPPIPAWAAAVVSAVLTAIYLIAAIAALIARREVESVGDKVAQSTAFIRTLTAQAAALVPRASSPHMRDALNGVYEAIRYSDPSSSGSLANVENRIRAAFTALTAAVDADDVHGVQEQAHQLALLLQERSKACRLLK